MDPSGSIEGLPRYKDIIKGDKKNVRFRHYRHDRKHLRRRARRVLVLLAAAILIYHAYSNWNGSRNASYPQLLSVERLKADHAACIKLQAKPHGPAGTRERSARYVSGSKPTLIKNATIWTGEPEASSSKYQWQQGDVFLEYGLIKRIELEIALRSVPEHTEVYDAKGRPLTAGIVDMHSHAGVDSLPSLNGNEDTNELSSDITPYVRSIDGIQPLDHQIQVIKSGGVTTSLILPGSGNNIGGEAYVIKHAVGPPDGRLEIAPEEMLADPDRTWRYIKMACGENAKRVYGRVGRNFGPFSRLGEAWYFRHAFEQARKFVTMQDDWCATADRIGAENMPTYLPAELRWETLGAVLRGQVRVNTHCYTIPDLEAFVRHTNEFEFEIQAFHHAHQTYLVPDILKRAYGNHTPAAALFADNMYYKAEAYIGSEQAGKILYENGVTPVYVSDNPVINAQHVVFEAAKAFKYGLPYEAALAGVTSKSAEILGLGERIGKIKAGFDADVVVWDSDPLSVGAAPVQVWIDGIAQYVDPVELKKPFSRESLLLKPESHGSSTDEVTETKNLVVTGISKFLHPSLGHSAAVIDGAMVIKDSNVLCAGSRDSCAAELEIATDTGTTAIHLNGTGYVTLPMTAFGSFLGLVEITAESDTQDGGNGGDAFTLAALGLAFETKNLKVAYAHGVTKAISAPQLAKYGGHKGVSAGFLTNAKHALKEGAVWEKEVAVHYTLTPQARGDKTPSMSSAVQALIEKLEKAAEGGEAKTLEEKSLRRVAKDGFPLVITVHSADVIAALLQGKAFLENKLSSALKQQTQEEGASRINLVIFGGAESHLIAAELAASGTPVVLAPFQPYSETWDQRRSLTGAPLTNGTHFDKLLDAGVKVAISSKEDWETRDLDLFAGIAFANSGGKLDERAALALVSTNIYDILGVKQRVSKEKEFVIFEGNPLEIRHRVRAVADGSGIITTWT